VPKCDIERGSRPKEEAPEGGFSNLETRGSDEDAGFAIPIRAAGCTPRDTTARSRTNFLPSISMTTKENPMSQ
jgi:hypothetical protein